MTTQAARRLPRSPRPMADPESGLHTVGWLILATGVGASALALVKVLSPIIEDHCEQVAVSAVVVEVDDRNCGPLNP